MMKFKNDSQAARERLASMTATPVIYEQESTPAASPLLGRKQLRDAAVIQLDRIAPDRNQPRTEFDEEALERMAESLKSRGLLQPIRVRWDAGLGLYVLVAGERRFRAAKKIGWTEISCIVESKALTPDEILKDQLIENCVRDDLKPIEQARAFRTFMEKFGLTQVQLAQELSVTQSAVSQALALLKLPEQVQELVEAGDLTPTAAHAVTAVPVENQVSVARAAIEEKMTVAEIQEVVKAIKARKPTASVTKIEPVNIDCGDLIVTVKWKRGAKTSDPIAALRKAIKHLQSQERSESESAA